MSTVTKVNFQNNDLVAKVDSYRSTSDVSKNDDMVRVEMCMNKHIWRRMHKHLVSTSWISVNDKLPEVRPGKFSVAVLVVMFDPVFEEIHPTGGATTEECLFNGKQFLEFGTNGNCGWDFIPTSSPITHWMYLPTPIREKRR